MRAALLLLLAGGCHAAAQPAAPAAPASDDDDGQVGEQGPGDDDPVDTAHPDRDPPPLPRGEPGREGELAPVRAQDLCVTHGKLSAGARAIVREPSVRAVAQGTAGDVGAIHFTYRGPSAKTSKLKSGAVREQLALKLRAADGCNLIYVSWRFAPKAEIVVQTKLNPGAHDGKACGTAGYTRIKPAHRARIAAPDPDSDHVLGALIDGSSLVALVDGKEVWRGALPASVASLRGPVGVRTDNVAADLDVYALPGHEESGSKCEPATGD